MTQREHAYTPIHAHMHGIQMPNLEVRGIESATQLPKH